MRKVHDVCIEQYVRVEFKTARYLLIIIFFIQKNTNMTIKTSDQKHSSLWLALKNKNILNIIHIPNRITKIEYKIFHPNYLHNVLFVFLCFECKTKKKKYIKKCTQ